MRKILILMITVLSLNGINLAHSTTISPAQTNEKGEFERVVKKMAPQHVEKPIPCVVIIEDESGQQYVGYAEAFTIEEACDLAYEDAKSHM